MWTQINWKFWSSRGRSGGGRIGVDLGRSFRGFGSQEAENSGCTSADAFLVSPNYCVSALAQSGQYERNRLQPP
jgi:hypothetical protein